MFETMWIIVVTIPTERMKVHIELFRDNHGCAKIGCLLNLLQNASYIETNHLCL